MKSEVESRCGDVRRAEETKQLRSWMAFCGDLHRRARYVEIKAAPEVLLHACWHDVIVIHWFWRYPDCLIIAPIKITGHRCPTGSRLRRGLATNASPYLVAIDPWLPFEPNAHGSAKSFKHHAEFMALSALMFYWKEKQLLIILTIICTLNREIPNNK